jgi:uncharacterized protein YebE (UPF0316 family)
MKLLVLFIVLSVVNVILQTFKSLATVKCGKVGAALVNATAYGLYTVVLVYTNADFPLWEKVLVTAVCNLVGVYIVKAIEEKARKDKLWKVETTVNSDDTFKVRLALRDAGLSYSVISTNTKERSVFNIYCPTKKESEKVKEILGNFDAKYFVTESKSL